MADTGVQSVDLHGWQRGSYTDIYLDVGEYTLTLQPLNIQVLMAMYTLRRALATVFSEANLSIAGNRDSPTCSLRWCLRHLRLPARVFTDFDSTVPDESHAGPVLDTVRLAKNDGGSQGPDVKVFTAL